MNIMKNAFKKAGIDVPATEAVEAVEAVEGKSTARWLAAIETKYFFKHTLQEILAGNLKPDGNGDGNDAYNCIVSFANNGIKNKGGDDFGKSLSNHFRGWSRLRTLLSEPELIANDHYRGHQYRWHCVINKNEAIKKKEYAVKKLLQEVENLQAEIENLQAEIENPAKISWYSTGDYRDYIAVDGTNELGLMNI